MPPAVALTGLAFPRRSHSTEDCQTASYAALACAARVRETPLNALKPPSTESVRVTKRAPGPHSQRRPDAAPRPRRSAPAGVRATIVAPRSVSAAVLVEQQAAVLLADEEARSDRVDRDRGRQLDGEPAREVLDRRLRGRVADDPRDGARRGHRGDVDDRPAVLDGGRRTTWLGSRVPEQVEVDDLAERLLGGRRGSRPASSVAPATLPPAALTRMSTLPTARARRSRAAISSSRRSTSAVRPSRSGPSTSGARRASDRDARSGRRKAVGHRRAQRARAAGDDRHLAVEAEPALQVAAVRRPARYCTGGAARARPAGRAIQTRSGPSCNESAPRGRRHAAARAQSPR